MSRDLRPLTAIPHPIVCVILRVGVRLPTDVILRQAQFSTRRPTRLDKIKNFRIEVQVSPVDWQPTLVRAQMRRVAGQSSQRLGFYSEDLKSAMRLPAMS